MPIMRVIISLLFALFCHYSNAQSGLLGLQDARAIAMGRISSIHQGIDAAFNNIAGLASIESLGFVASAERRFLLNETQNFGLAAAIPSNNGAFGVRVGSFGFEAYNENSISLGYSRQLSERMSIGGEFIYWNRSIPEYGSQGFLTFAVGLQAKVFEQVLLGFHLFNPIRSAVNDEENTFPVVQIGVNYLVSDQLQVSAELEKDIDFPAIFRSGIDYKIQESLALRLGISTAPTLFTAGIGLDISPAFHMDIAGSIHQILGFTPGISVQYQK